MEDRKSIRVRTSFVTFVVTIVVSVVCIPMWAQFRDSSARKSPLPVDPILYEIEQLIRDLRVGTFAEVIQDTLHHQSISPGVVHLPWIIARLRMLADLYTHDSSGIGIGSGPDRSAHGPASQRGSNESRSVAVLSLSIEAIDSLRRLASMAYSLRSYVDTLRLALKGKTDSLVRLTGGSSFQFGVGFLANWYLTPVKNYYLSDRDSVVYMAESIPFSGFTSMIMLLELTAEYRLGLSVPLTELRLGDKSASSGLFQARVPFGILVARVIREQPPTVTFGAVVHLIPVDELVVDPPTVPQGNGNLMRDLDLSNYPSRKATKVGIGVGLMVEF